MRILPSKPSAKPPAEKRFRIRGEDEDLVKRQLQFRRERKALAEKQKKLLGAMMYVAEDDENRSRWIRLTAVMVLQLYVRFLQRQESGSSPTPLYKKKQWTVPDTTELARRHQILKERFPLEQPDSLLELLVECRGHGGYAAAAVLERQEPQ